MIDTTEITTLLTPYIVALVGLVITLMFKDYAAGMAKGLAFKMSGDFKEGDKVIIDGCKAVIVKIGSRKTVFGLQKENGDYHWRYVDNESVNKLKLEKVIWSSTPEKNGEMIQKNSEKIEKISNSL